MDKNSKILICGLHKIVNNAFMRRFAKDGFTNVNDVNGISLDLSCQDSVMGYFKDYTPDIVVYTGSVSGGISANIGHPAEFIYKNLISQANVINSAKEVSVGKLIYFASSCVYPKDSPEPLKEEFLLTGSLEETSECYAVAKIAGIKMCTAYNKQYGTSFITVVPATVYGFEDDFDLRSAHVIPALIRKFHAAKETKENFVEVWGSGEPRREFIFADDLIDACVFLLNNYSKNEHINVGTSKDYSISELVSIISEVVSFRGKIRYEKGKPEGVKRKLLDSTKILSLGWRPKTSLRDGINITYNWFREHGPASAKLK